MPEHRTIAVAFVQFAGTDALLSEEGPEATALALDDCIRNVSQAAAAHGVTFFETDINADGGKIMLTAGAPRAAGHDADRMLRTARQVLDHRRARAAHRREHRSRLLRRLRTAVPQDLLGQG